MSRPRPPALTDRTVVRDGEAIAIRRVGTLPDYQPGVHPPAWHSLAPDTDTTEWVPWAAVAIDRVWDGATDSWRTAIVTHHASTVEVRFRDVRTLGQTAAVTVSRSRLVQRAARSSPTHSCR